MNINALMGTTATVRKSVIVHMENVAQRPVSASAPLDGKVKI